MKKNVFLFITLIFAVAFLTQLPDNRLHIFFCDVGQGDGILLTKGSTQIVIDGGPNNEIVNCMGSHVPFWDKKIEVVLNTHADLDHYFGFVELFKHYEIENFFESGVESNAERYKELMSVIDSKKTNVKKTLSGQVINFGGVNIKILFPTSTFLDTHSKMDRNDFSAVAYLKYGKFTGLFTGDIQPTSEKEMLRLNLVSKAYLLKVPHHGSVNGLISDVLKLVNPKIAIISVGEKNKFGHPSTEVLNMLNEAHVVTYRTDKNGEIEIITDGNKVWVNE